MRCALTSLTILQSHCVDSCRARAALDYADTQAALAAEGGVCPPSIFPASLLGKLTRLQVKEQNYFPIAVTNYGAALLGGLMEAQRS